MVTWWVALELQATHLPPLSTPLELASGAPCPFPHPARREKRHWGHLAGEGRTSHAIPCWTQGAILPWDLGWDLTQTLARKTLMLYPC